MLGAGIWLQIGASLFPMNWPGNQCLRGPVPSLPGRWLSLGPWAEDGRGGSEATVAGPLGGPAAVGAGGGLPHRWAAPPPSTGPAAPGATPLSSLAWGGGEGAGPGGGGGEAVGG